MNEEQLRAMFDKAAKVVEHLPQHLQATAFAIATESLDEYANSKRKTRLKESRPAKERPASPGPSTPARRQDGPKATLEQMITDGYFSVPRLMGDMIGHAESTLARRFAHTDFSPALIRLVHEKKLRRQRNKEGQYEYLRA